MTTASNSSLSEAAAHEHNEGVIYILDRLPRRGASDEQVIKAGVEFAVDRGLSPRFRTDFRGWVTRSMARARSGAALQELSGSESLKNVLVGYLAAARAADANGTGDADLDRLDAVVNASLSGDERALAQLVSGVARGSIELWAGNGSDTASGLRKEKLDKGEIIESDVMGAIGSAAGAALAMWWTGPLTWGGALAGAVAGARNAAHPSPAATDPAVTATIGTTICQRCARSNVASGVPASARRPSVRRWSITAPVAANVEETPASRSPKPRITAAPLVTSARLVSRCTWASPSVHSGAPFR